MTEQTLTDKARVAEVRDITQEHWHFDLSYQDGWGFVQVMTINDKSPFFFPPEVIDTNPSTGEPLYGAEEHCPGWAVTLDKERFGEFLRQAQAVYERMSD